MIKERKKIFSTKSAVFCFVFVLFLFVFSLWSIENWDNVNIGGYESAIYPWVMISLLITCVGFLCVKKASFSDIIFLFTVFSYLFMFGHVFVKVHELSTTLLWQPGYYYDNIDKFHASIYALFSLNFITLGAISTGLSVNVDDKSVYKEEADRCDKKMASTGWILFWVGMISNLITSGKIIITTMRAGSYAEYTSANISGVLDDFSFCLIPGFTYIVASKTLSKYKKFSLFVFVIFFYLFTMVFSGSRRTQLFAIITICICYVWHLNKGKIPFRWFLLALVGGTFFLNLMYVIRENRLNLITIIPTFFDGLVNFKFLGSVLGETFAETGLSFYSVVAIFTTVPAIFPYEYGMTFLRTLPSILPIGWLVGDFFYKAASTNVINRYTGLPVGASLIGDFYWNFGLLGGIIFSFVFGFVISKMGNRLLNSNRNNPLYFSLLYVIILGVRSGIFEIFRPMVMVLLVPLVVRKINFK